MHTDERIVFSKQGNQPRGKMILYWMQAAQRDRFNPALDRAIELANLHKLPLLVLFCIDYTLPRANMRHYHFMFQGLIETGKRLGARGIPVIISRQMDHEAIRDLAEMCSELVMDSGYLDWQKLTRKRVQDIPIPMTEIETEAVVPVRLTSSKIEYSAATIRPKIIRHLADFLDQQPDAEPQYQRSADALAKEISKKPCFELLRSDHTTEELETVHIAYASEIEYLPPVTTQIGGYAEALRKLDRFISQDLADYREAHSDPATDRQSGLSPYLHFGQISALEIMLRITDAFEVAPERIPEYIKRKSELSGYLGSIADFAEELIIRRELSMNYCLYQREYWSYDLLPAWARKSLESHRRDTRPYIYSIEELESGQTHDPYWNAAQSEMVITGKMHNYMRMYWGKKVIEWTSEPEQAFYTLLYLNNKYELDGRDANAFVGVGWCFGLHDRPWQERPIFGSVRYMNSAGLLRKFDMRSYLRRVAELGNSQDV